jgi:hypothetical protein
MWSGERGLPHQEELTVKKFCALIAFALATAGATPTSASAQPAPVITTASPAPVVYSTWGGNCYGTTYYTQPVYYPTTTYYYPTTYYTTYSGGCCRPVTYCGWYSGNCCYNRCGTVIVQRRRWCCW